MLTASEFLKTGKKFQLGFLETEKPHPLTIQLSDLVQEDLPQAIDRLVTIDVMALEKLKLKAGEIVHLRAAIEDTFESGGRVFICGCGATGRLSLLNEVLFREANPKSDQVIAFMAGGDVALVHSLEGFEDFPEYGERHLKELGFGKNDLLISPTEGGETPYVIGATEAAARISLRKPFFMYCNPDEVLCANVERSKHVIENPKIEKINLTVGSRALAGSTRMQASTVLQLAIGLALHKKYDDSEIKHELTLMQEYLKENAPILLPRFIELESGEYNAGRYIIYSVQDYAITVFTDTTERAPTFSLTPFSHKNATKLLKLKPSLSYVSLRGTKNAKEAWQKLLCRQPRSLNWGEVDQRTESEYMNDFDFSKNAKEFRKTITGDAEHSEFEIYREDNAMKWQLLGHEMELEWPQRTSPLFEHTILKMLLNMHSTCVMGRLGRYKRNLMTWVYPTNGKLIDRASRYVQVLLKEDGLDVSYAAVVEKLFEMKSKVDANSSIVLATYEALKSTR